MSFPVGVTSVVKGSVNRGSAGDFAGFQRGRLLINSDKSKLLLLGTPQMVQRMPHLKTSASPVTKSTTTVSPL